MGAVQGLCLPFRGFSRSGATISTGLLTGANRMRAERFSFALAVILTPAALAREALRVVKASHAAAATGAPLDLHSSFVAALLGMVFSFLAGLAALRWLSSATDGLLRITLPKRISIRKAVPLHAARVPHS